MSRDVKSRFGDVVATLRNVSWASWAHIGAILGHLEAPKAHRKRKGEKASIIYFPLVAEGCWPLGGGPEGAPRALGAVLWPSWGLLGPLRRIVGYLEPAWRSSWSIGGPLGAVLGPIVQKDGGNP